MVVVADDDISRRKQLIAGVCYGNFYIARLKTRKVVVVVAYKNACAADKQLLLHEFYRRPLRSFRRGYYRRRLVVGKFNAGKSAGRSHLFCLIIV